MKKYLYLTEISWADAWIKGGNIPISKASKYQSDERRGIYTPDENLIHDSEVDIHSLMAARVFSSDSTFRGLTMTGCTVNGVRIPDFYNASYYKEDGIILSFCNVFDIGIALGLEKKACVEIRNINHLRNILNRLLRKTAKAGNCQYTDSHQRSHFLKSSRDAWQQEYRLFWRLPEARTVTLPPGMAKLVWVADGA